MHRCSLVYIVLLGALSRAAAPAGAQGAAASAQGPLNIPVFAGETTNIILGAWGGGKAEAVTEPVLLGGQSLRVTTEGLYQGGRLDFKNPVDLAPAFSNAKSYMRFQLRFLGKGSTQATYDPVSGETRQSASSPFHRMRFLLTMADGARRELIRAVDMQRPEDPDAWIPMAFPLSAILKKPGAKPPDPGAPAPTGEGAKLAQLVIFGDKYQQFNIGEIDVVTDDTEISVVSLEEQVAFVNNELTFTASAEGGVSTLHYTWDFDYHADKGFQEDRAGRTVKYFWRKPGKYTVAVMVSDADGLKKPVLSTVTIDVSE